MQSESDVMRRVLGVIKGSRKKGEGKRGKGLTLGRFYATMEKKGKERKRRLRKRPCVFETVIKDGKGSPEVEFVVDQSIKLIPGPARTIIFPI